MNETKRVFRRFSYFLQLALLVVLPGATIQAAGEVDPAFNPGLAFEETSYPYSEVEKIFVQPDGKVLIAGYFSAVGKINSFGVARLNADGSVDATFRAPSLTAMYNTYAQRYLLNAVMAQADGKVIIAGNFNSVNGQPRNGLARLNADGSYDASFNPPLITTNYSVPYVAELKPTADNKIFVSGFFGYNGGANKNLVRLNADGSVDPTFAAPAVIGSSQTGNRRVEVLPDGKILTATAATVYRLNADGSIDAGFNSPFFSGTSISALRSLADGKFLVGGEYTQVNGFVLKNLARFNADGTIDPGFNTGNAGPNLAVLKIEVLPNNQLFIGGEFSMFNGVNRSNIARINQDGSLDNSLIFNNTASANDVALLADGRIIIGGQASEFLPARALVRLNPNGVIETNQTLVAHLGSASRIYVLPDNKILVGGSYTHIDGQARNGLVRLNADGSIDTGFSAPFVGGVNNLDIRADGKILVAGGNLYRLNSNGGQEIALGLGGTLDAKFLPGGGFIVSANLSVRKYPETSPLTPVFTVTANGNIDTILLQPDGKFIVSGHFTIIGGQTRGRIARLNADGSVDATFNSSVGANSSIFKSVLQPDGKIIIGGNFSGVNFNTNYKNLARLNQDGSLDTTFNPVVEGGVQSLKLQPDGKILLGGGIYQVGGVACGSVARINADGSLDSTFSSGTEGYKSVLSIDLQADNIVIGGMFTRLNNFDRLGVARLSNRATRRPAFDFDGDGKADVSVFRPSAGAWFVQRSTSGFAAYNFGTAGDIIAPADYDGDGKTDPAVYRSGVWYLQRSTLGFAAVQFGTASDVVVPADYDADGKADIAVWRPSNGVWYRIDASNQTVGTQFGQAGDLATPADYDADGKTDLAVYRAGVWYLQRSTLGFTGVQFGLANDKPAAADFDGDGKADIAVFRPSNGVWYLNRSTEGFTGIQFGVAEDLPIPNAFVR